MDVNGRKAVVFGGTSGIGLAASMQLAELGAQVVAVSRNPDKACDVSSVISLAKCDVTDEEAVARFLEQEAPFDILINAATGGERAMGSFMDMDMGSFRASFAKLWGYTNVVRHGASYLPEDGTIVLVSGTPAKKCKPGQIALSAVGGAVEAFARSFAAEIAPRRINVVSPGVIDTPLIGLQGQERETYYKNLTQSHLIPRTGTADEVAKGIVFVVQNDFVTGTTVDVDGGFLQS